MHYFDAFEQKKFWKATLINAAFIAIIIMLTTTYLFLIGQSLKRLEQTEFIKLKITEPAEIMQHTKELLKTTPAINRIYAEWSIQTIAYFALTVITHAIFYGNTLGILNKNKFLNKQELKKFSKQSAIIIGLAFAVLLLIILTGKTKTMIAFLALAATIFYLLITIISAAIVSAQKTFFENITVALQGIRFFILRFLAGFFTFLIALFLLAKIFIQINSIAMPILATITLIIWTTWTAQIALRAIQCEKHN